MKKERNIEYKNLVWYNLYGTVHKNMESYAEIMNNTPETSSYWNSRLLIKIDFFNCERPMLKSQYVRTPQIVEQVNENFDMIEEYKIRAHVLKGVAVSYKYNEYSITVAWGGS